MDVEFIKAELEVYLHPIVPADIHGVDEMGEYHLPRLKAAFGVEVGPAQELVVLVSYTLGRGKKVVERRLRFFLTGLRSSEPVCGFGHERVEQLGVERAFTAYNLDGLGAVVVQLLDNAVYLVLCLLQPYTGQLDLTLALLVDDLGLRRCGYLRELHPHDLFDHRIHLGYRVAGLPVAFAGMPDVVVALVADVLGHRDVPVLLAPAGRERQPVAAVGAEDVADEQGAALAVARHRAARHGALAHYLLGAVKGGVVDDAQFLQICRPAVAILDDAGIHHVLDDAIDRGVGEAFPIAAVYAGLVEIFAEPLRPIALIHILAEYEPHYLGLVLVNSQVTDLTVSLVHAPAFFKVVAERHCAAGVETRFRHLTEAGLDTDGGLDALAGGLPVAYVVHQLVDVIVESLLALSGAPDLDAVADEPLHNERSLVVAASEAVKHENEKDVKFAIHGVALYLLNGVAVPR